ncbi:PLP-dependent aminotransferase family protein [Hafnia alvei]|uniref:GntR family transcriptional regulator/aspartate aminotransferase n=1 Tax=Hafnia alvei ATCC 13337 TaxID=910996 RepID=A0ABD3ZH93_HAFAL|nr:PLP-dependent aminotransferase family protein [Hafnia alvei]KFC88090.1 GntR family transcriptional regulator/aspartate aminotransferase [Hafnia alvei ATCC 13337]QBJ35249.1 PLP-dependent aminotransferase family protein [Hafnia alvei]RLR08384.1 PLP-dependent aminotransferase family protein [Hafnia alvei ATCC 13337]TBM29284.1 PLP-dependent aminotransferase family protein [Hafnia alvei]
MQLQLTGIKLEAGRKRSQQLYLLLRELIASEPLCGGSKLPATRELAKMLGVSRNTVMNAYERLFADGFLETRVGDGTYITLAGSGTRGQAQPSPPLNPPLHAGLRLPIAQQFNRHIVHDGLPSAFRIGLPALDLFPFETWSRLQNRFWRREPIQHMGYGDPAGDIQLRELIAHYLRSARGLACDPAQILVTLGAQQAIMVSAAMLLRAEDEVVMENPCYWAAAGAFSCLGVHINAVGVDDDGLLTHQLAQIPKAKMAYVCPSCQYPTGVTMSLPRRLELLNWAIEREAWILEDDYDGEYRYSGTPLMPLAALDQSNRVIYIGSFSKVMYPGLRLGYMVAPPQLVSQLTLLRTMASRQPPINDQRVMADFIAEGHFQPHIRRMRRAGQLRRDALLKSWCQHLSHIGSMPEVASGLHVTIRLPNFEREQTLVAQAMSAGIEITPLSSLWLPESEENANHYGLILGFAGVSESAIERAVLKLKDIWR